MSIVKGFVNIQSLVSNIQGTVAALGELSPNGFTYSKEKGYYSSSSLSDYELVTFTSVDASGVSRALTGTEVDHIVAMVDFLRGNIASKIPPYNIDNIHTAILDHFIEEVGNVKLGAINSGPSCALPEWVSWKLLATDLQIHIWLSDEAFCNQYDEAEVLVVPPVLNLDTFFAPIHIVAADVYGQTVDKIMERTNDAKQGYPETYIRMLRYNFIVLSDPTRTIETVWTVLIYGDKGDNIDSIKDAIIDYILTHSTRSRQEWETIFPDIFKRTEFLILPRWDLYSIPNRLTQQGLYSQLLNTKEAINFVKSHVSFYTQQHIEDNTYVTSYPYKSLALSIVNGEFNIDGKKDFKTLFPDYIPIPATSMDYARMSLKTQELFIALEEMLLIAESMGEFTYVPRTMRRVKRAGKLYLTRLLDNINYVVMPKIDLT